MHKLLNFIDVWGKSITLFFVILVFFRTCNTNNKIEKLEKKIISNQLKQDSTLNELKKEIKIEGLKSEKRMIQSTDRKILDVNRQTEIDKELSELEK